MAQDGGEGPVIAWAGKSGPKPCSRLSLRRDWNYGTVIVTAAELRPNWLAA
jgi:hypothetical protein